MKIWARVLCGFLACIALPASAELGFISAGYFEREGWHYLVVERAALTSGADVTAHLILARSHNIEGPYMDKEGRPFGQTDRPYWFDMARYQNASTPMITIDVGGKFLLHIEDYSRLSGGILPPISYDITWDKGWPSVIVK